MSKQSKQKRPWSAASIWSTLEDARKDRASHCNMSQYLKDCLPDQIDESIDGTLVVASYDKLTIILTPSGMTRAITRMEP